jgi:hypothetical protein
MNVGFFAEDEGHRAFIPTLLHRIAELEQIPIEVHERSAIGGLGTALRSLRRYVRDLGRGADDFLEVLVVAVDANCHGVRDRRRHIEEIVKAYYAGVLVVATPDPHIERWYLADPFAIGRVLGQRYAAQVPAQKCERHRYKRALREAFLAIGVDPPAGGIVYGEDIALAMDLREAERQPDLARFISDYRAAIRQLAGSS